MSDVFAAMVLSKMHREQMAAEAARITDAERATLASLRAGTHVVVPREPTQEMLGAAFPASTAWGVWRLMLAASEASGHE